MVSIWFNFSKLTSSTRKLLLAINNCVYNYGKYLEAFKQSFVYELKRIKLDELSEVLDITAKDELEEDEKLKIIELENLGLLAKFITAVPVKGAKDKDNISSFNAEMNSITDKVKQECQKIYIGEYAKLINNPDKMNPSLVPFIAKLKTDMENFRLKCIRDLRTYVIIFPNNSVKIFHNTLSLYQHQWLNIFTSTTLITTQNKRVFSRMNSIRNIFYLKILRMN